MTRSALPRIAFVLVVVAGCGKPASPTAPTAAPAATEPDLPKPASPLTLRTDDAPPSLFGVVAIADPKAAIADLRAFVGSFNPDASAAITEASFDALVGGMLQTATIAGLDHAAPLYVLMVDPHEAPMPLAVSAAVADEASLRSWIAGAGGALDVELRDGRAVIGSPSVLGTVANYARGALIATPPPARPTITVFTEPVVAAYRPQITAWLDELERSMSQTSAGLMGPVASWYVDGVASLLDQLRASTIEATLDGDGATVIIGLIGAPRTALAEFAARQHPSAYRTLGMLPPGDQTMLMAGDMDWAPIRDQLATMATAAMPGVGDNAAVHDAILDFMKLYAGELVVGGDVADGFSFVTLVEVTDGERALAAMRRQAAELTQAGAATRFAVVGSPAFEHAGVPVDEYRVTVDYDKLPAASRPIFRRMYGDGVGYTAASIDRLYVNVMAKDARARTESILTALTGAAPTTAAGVAAERAATSRKHRESAFLWFDLGRAMAAASPTAPSVATGVGIGFGIGFSADGMRVRLAMNSRAIAKLASGAIGAPPARTTPAANAERERELVDAISALADRACQCPDMACAEQVQAELMDLVKDAKEPSKAAQDQIMKDMERMGECMSKLAK